MCVSSGLARQPTRHPSLPFATHPASAPPTHHPTPPSLSPQLCATAWAAGRLAAPVAAAGGVDAGVVRRCAELLLGPGGGLAGGGRSPGGLLAEVGPVGLVRLAEGLAAGGHADAGHWGALAEACRAAAAAPGGLAGGERVALAAALEAGGGALRAGRPGALDGALAALRG